MNFLLFTIRMRESINYALCKKKVTLLAFFMKYGKRWEKKTLLEDYKVPLSLIHIQPNRIIKACFIID